MRAIAAAPLRARHGWRRWCLVIIVRARARRHHARVTCMLAPDVRIGRNVRVRVAPGTTSELRLGPGCRIGDGVRIELRGGSLVLGRHVDVRHACVMGVAGRLFVEGPAVLQHGCTFHCDESIVVGAYAGLGEYVTVIDSSHVMDGPSTWFVDDMRTGPVVIGAHAWVGAKATVTRGVRIGDHAVVGANSTVATHVAPGAFVSGVPAVVVRAGSGPVSPRTAASPARAPQAPATVAGITPDPGRVPIDVLSRSS